MEITKFYADCSGDLHINFEDADKLYWILSIAAISIYDTIEITGGKKKEVYESLVSDVIILQHELNKIINSK